MAHNNYQQMMSLALDGMLAAADETALQQHLDSCAACTAVWEAMSGLETLFEQAPMVNPPADFSARVMARVTIQKAGRRRAESIFWFVLLAILGVVLLAQWIPALAPLAASAIPVLPGPVASLIEQAEPLLETLKVLGTAFVVLGEALSLWLNYIAGLPAAWAAGLVTLSLVATWVGLIGVFGPGWSGHVASEAVRVQ